MSSLPHFCRICLKYDKNLIDLAHIENEPNETLMSKLQFCASEVEWITYKPLLCHPCIKRLNIAYYFKKECLQSANVLKSYLQLLKESQQKGQNAEGEGGQQSGTYMLLPNQKYLKILVGAQNQNSFQNVFLNVVPPANSSGTPTPPPLVPTSDSSSPNNKDNNQNIFLNINNIFKKYVPIAPSDASKANNDKNNLNVSQLLTNSKTEELSVEIDPTDYGLVDEGESSNEEVEHDWEELITHSKINSDVSISRVSSNKSKGGGPRKERDDTRKPTKTYNYVPILPKRGGIVVDDDKMEFFDAGQHFLSSSQGNDRNSREYSCEPCQRTFSALCDLRSHIKQFHMGKLPYKCKYCYVEFFTRADYELCMTFHKEREGQNNSLTLEDFANGANENVGKATSTPQHSAQPTITENENGDYECDVCKRVFASSTGLLRHKVRKHNQKNKKKYFIKGMKNAQCDICKREFSTQSYMQLHRKLHLRDVTGYKYKVFGKNKYQGDKEEGKKGKPKISEVKVECVEPDINEAETIDCTPDIICKSEGESDEDEEREFMSGQADQAMEDVIEVKDTDDAEDVLQNGDDLKMDVDKPESVVEKPESVELSKIVKNCKTAEQILANQINSDEITIEERKVDTEEK